MPEQLSIESIIKDLDTADELRETAAVRVASYHRRLEKSIQQTRETLSVPAKGPGFKESLRKHNRSSGRKVLGQLGRAIYCNTSR